MQLSCMPIAVYKKAQTSTMNSMFIFCMNFFVVLDYDEMDCNIVFRDFYYVFSSVGSGYIQ